MNIVYVECQNCGRIWDSESVSLETVEDLANRISPGETVPYGECIACGSLCHEYEGAFIDQCPVVDCGLPLKLVQFVATCDIPVTQDGWSIDGPRNTSEEKFSCSVHGLVPSDWVAKNLSWKEAAEFSQNPANPA